MTGSSETDRVAGVVLAAGAGTRLRPLTDLRPKALCPVGNVPLVDHALRRARGVTSSMAVNVCHGREALEAYLSDRDVHISVEQPEALETAGALGKLRDWIDGRDVLTVNGDTVHDDDLAGFVSGWDHERPRLLTVRDESNGDFDDLRYVGVALLPWRIVRQLPPRRHGLYAAVIAPAHERGELDLYVSEAAYFDCGTPAEYLAANLACAGDGSLVADDAEITGQLHRCVVGSGAEVAGRLDRVVVWDGAVVGADEDLTTAIRADDGTTVDAS